MKVDCLQENLNKALGITNKALPKKTVLPVLSNTLISVNGDKIVLTSTDQKLTISCTIKAENQGQILVESTKFLAPPQFGKLISSLSGEKITLDIEDTRVSLKSSKTSAKFNTPLVDDFPDISDISGAEFAIKSSDLKQALNQVVFCAASDMSRPTLHGILLSVDNGFMRTEGADGYQLAQMITPVHTDKKVSILIPSNSLDEVRKVLPDDDSEIKVVIGENDISFQVGDNIKILNKKLYGDYPNINNLLPKEHSIKVKFKSTDFLRAMRSVLALSSGKSVINIVVNSDSINLSIGSEIGESSSTIEATRKSKEEDTNSVETISTSCNGDYLEGFLSSVQSENMRMVLTEPTKPILFTVGNTYKYVIMPWG